MKTALLSMLICSSSAAMASSPSDFHLSDMTQFEGEVITNPVILQTAFDKLIRDLGSALAHPAAFPAETPGSSGFDVSLGNTFVILEPSDGGAPTHWQRATGTSDHEELMYIPSVTARKGLPLSMEIGASVGWLAGGQSGTFGGFFRAAVVEGYKPWPDLTLHIGYNGLVGHPELDMGVMDVGVTLGSTFAFGSVPGIHEARISPWIDFSLLQMFTKVRLDDESTTAIFGEQDENEEEDSRGKETYWLMPRIGGGVQITNGTVFFRLAGAWSPKSVPTIFAGMGFSY